MGSPTPPGNAENVNPAGQPPAPVIHGQECQCETCKLNTILERYQASQRDLFANTMRDFNNQLQQGGREVENERLKARVRELEERARESEITISQITTALEAARGDASGSEQECRRLRDEVRSV
jgi:hypothetical protein